MRPTHLAVLLALAWAAGAMAFLYRKVKAYGKRKLYAPAAGDPAAGVRYAFTGGLAPWAKESVRMNLPSYAAGMAFHAGVGTSAALALTVLAGLDLPGFLLLPARLLTFAGAAGGFSLFMKRLFKPGLRGLSCLDDYLSNLLSSLFILLAFDWTFRPALESLWLAEAAVLLAYAPLGKIRHCLLFFTTRYQMGAFFGRRGTFPPGGNFHA